MKNFKYIVLSVFSMFVITSCQEDDLEFGEISAPSNIQVNVDIVGADADNPNGDGSGVVNLTASADGATTYQFVYNGTVISSPSGKQTYNFAVLGLNTYSITVLAFGTAGVSTSTVIEIDVLSLYEPPADLLEMLYGDGERTWRIKNEAGGHFGLGPAGGDPFSFFSAGADSKEGVGMYDDRYIFNINGTFTHIVDSTNDDPSIDTSGTVFGRVNLINELGGAGGGTQNGADIENYGYEDYTETHTLSAPGGVETISITGIGFLGYYVGGNHQYQILSRNANEMVVKTTDGNGEFDWGFTLIAED